LRRRQTVHAVVFAAIGLLINGQFGAAPQSGQLLTIAHFQPTS
jgi:hypothetical protein